MISVVFSTIREKYLWRWNIIDKSKRTNKKKIGNIENFIVIFCVWTLDYGGRFILMYLHIPYYVCTNCRTLIWYRNIVSCGTTQWQEGEGVWGVPHCFIYQTWQCMQKANKFSNKKKSLFFPRCSSSDFFFSFLSFSSHFSFFFSLFFYIQNRLHSTTTIIIMRNVCDAIRAA